jgi:hypothetical protein
MSDDEVEVVENATPFTWPQQPVLDHREYIVRNKERQKLEGPIQEVDIVRPVNEKYTVLGGNEYRDRWIQKTTAGCPTYGNCSICYRSGPTGMACGFCNKKWAGYLIMSINRNGSPQIIDAQWLAGQLNKRDHVDAMANRIASWLTTPMKTFMNDESLQAITYQMELDASMDEQLKKSARELTFMKIRNELYAGWLGTEQM